MLDENSCHFGRSDKQRGPHPELLTHPEALWVRLRPGDQLYFPWLWWHASWGTPNELSSALTHFWELKPEKLRNLSRVASEAQRECAKAQGIRGVAGGEHKVEL